MSFLFAFIAGILSTLNPCVLPLLPMIIAATIAKNRYGLYALCLGLSLSFTGFGLFFATIGFNLGLDQEILRKIIAVVLIILGGLMIFPKLFEPIALKLSEFTSRFDRGLPSSSFLTGVMLGIIWTPCVGPTLGAASVLASKGENLGQVFLTMMIFSLGACIPLLIIGIFALKNSKGLQTSAALLKKSFGVLLLLTGVMIIIGLDKKLEAFLVNISPEWLINFTTRF